MFFFSFSSSYLCFVFALLFPYIVLEFPLGSVKYLSLRLETGCFFFREWKRLVWSGSSHLFSFCVVLSSNIVSSQASIPEEVSLIFDQSHISIVLLFDRSKRLEHFFSPGRLFRVRFKLRLSCLKPSCAPSPSLASKSWEGNESWLWRCSQQGGRNFNDWLSAAFSSPAVLALK